MTITTVCEIRGAEWEAVLPPTAKAEKEPVAAKKPEAKQTAKKPAAKKQTAKK